MHRRHAILAVACSYLPVAVGQNRGQEPGDIATALRRGQCVVMLRHAQTDPGIGDPPDFRIDQCGTQRNLSRKGLDQAVDIGRWFGARSLKPSAVRSSPWCRCLDTSRAAFGGSTVLPALGSTFGDLVSGPSDRDRSQTLLTLLEAIPVGQFEVWVTHQVNISAFTGRSTAMGEAVLVGRDGRAIAEMSFA